MPRMDREAIIYFAFNSFKSFMYSSLYFISLFAENFVKNWLCAAAEVGDLSIFFKKKHPPMAPSQLAYILNV